MITGAHHTDTTRAQMSETHRRLYAEGKGLALYLIRTPAGRARQIAGTVRYNRQRGACPDCGEIISPRQLSNHQRRKRCLELREETR